MNFNPQRFLLSISKNIDFDSMDRTAIFSSLVVGAELRLRIFLEDCIRKNAFCKKF